MLKRMAFATKGGLIVVPSPTRKSKGANASVQEADQLHPPTGGCRYKPKVRLGDSNSESQPLTATAIKAGIKKLNEMAAKTYLAQGAQYYKLLGDKALYEQLKKELIWSSSPNAYKIKWTPEDQSLFKAEPEPEYAEDFVNPVWGASNVVTWAWPPNPGDVVFDEGKTIGWKMEFESAVWDAKKHINIEPYVPQKVKEAKEKVNPLLKVPTMGQTGWYNPATDEFIPTGVLESEDEF